LGDNGRWLRNQSTSFGTNNLYGKEGEQKLRRPQFMKKVKNSNASCGQILQNRKVATDDSKSLEIR